MSFQNVPDALRALEDVSAGPATHLEAIRFLASLDQCFEAENLVRALQNDDFGVRWEAANLLAKMGRNAIHAVLKALIDPNRVADPRLREGIDHILRHNQDPNLQSRAAPLLKVIKGPAADIATMQAAYHLYMTIDPKDCPDDEDE